MMMAKISDPCRYRAVRERERLGRDFVCQRDGFFSVVRVDLRVEGEVSEAEPPVGDDSKFPRWQSLDARS